MGITVILLIAVILISVICIVYFGADCAGKINRGAAGAGVIYLLFPVLSGIILCIGAIGFDISSELNESYDALTTLSEMGIDFSKIIMYVIECVLAFPSFLLPCIGLIRMAVRSGKKSYDYDDEALRKLPVISAVIGTVFSAAVAVFVCFIAVNVLGYVVSGLLPMILFSIFIGLITFGIGFIIMAIVAPMYILAAGAYAVAVSLPTGICAAVCGLVFCTMEAVTVIFTIAFMRKLYKDNAISKKKAVIYSLLSALPAVNIISQLYMANKLKRSETL
ncbi:MAG: hypothetical protein SOT68_11045 [Oscillospiraceae bacterium]|nr:hypothetical protein [Oscillospiraceae bacterium]MDD7278357.1 hypothetical protein [Oscillospiraceae bacterium]MDY2864708.1 hypothetical protein [Oscillospiraceae bacterium]